MPAIANFIQKKDDMSTQELAYHIYTKYIMCAGISLLDNAPN